MAIYPSVDPERFIDPTRNLPANGRGAWTREGIGFLNRYTINPDGQPRIGTVAEQSLAHWSVAAGCHTIQTELIRAGHLAALADGERGIFGPRTHTAVKAFQYANTDPETGAQLVVDGIFGRPDARALFTPIIDAAEARHGVPRHLLRGECNHESALDPGSVGFYIYYGTEFEYRGVDRSAFQINSKAWASITWAQAYDFRFAADWSAKRMRYYRDLFASRYPGKSNDLYWDAAVLAHNNPSAAGKYANTGVMPSSSAAAYVSGVLNAIY